MSGGVEDGSGQRVLRGAFDPGGQAQDLVLLEPRCGHDRGDDGAASVRVPVLSTTRVVTFSIRSSASAFLISTPRPAPRPTPTMIDMGVARPRAQGQAMIRTATATIRAWASLGSGPTKAR